MTSDSLAPVADAWRAYRVSSGWLVTVEPCRTDSADALREQIRAWAQKAAEGPRAVLLLGPVPARAAKAPDGTATAPQGGIPTFRFKQLDSAIGDRRDTHFASDGPYQDLDDDGTPDLMLGRVPCSKVEHAQRVLDKIRRWEASSVSDAHRRVEIVAGEGRFGPYDRLLEVLTSSLLIDSVPRDFELRATYAKPSSPFCPPLSRAKQTVREQALSGALLFNYVGHGHETGFDSLWSKAGRARLLEAADLSAGDTADLRPGGVALLVCCSTGWYDDPASACMAEVLLRHPQGPIAVLAGSRPTHPYANAIVERDGVRALLRDRTTSVGAWDLAITRSLASSARDELDLIATPIAAMQKWALPLRQMRRDHALLYNLIGDPTTRIPHAPRADSISLERLSSRRLRATMADGSPPGALLAEVRLQARRRAAPPGVIPASGPDDPHLEDITTRNWPRANEWVRWRSEVELAPGQHTFEIELPESLPKDSDEIVVLVRQAMPDEQPQLVAATALDLRTLIGSARDEPAAREGLPPDRRPSSR